ncbi:MAG: hypothetical protein V1792_19580 [Pseudomonadota bacterium]
MGTVFQVLGIIFVVIVAVVLAAYFLIRRKLKAISKTLAGFAAQPSEINLVEEPSPAWMEKPGVQSMVKELDRLGFIRGRAYGIEEMPQVRLCSFFTADPAAACVLYEHDQAGNWADLVLKYEDGTDITITNAPAGEDIDTRPDSTKVFPKDATLAELCRELDRRLESKAVLAIRDADFKQTFEEAYRKDMEWRNKRGGITEEEVRRIAAKEDGEYDDSDIAEAMLRIKSGELLQLHEDCIGNFLRQNPGSARDDGHGLFVVSDQLDAACYVGYLAEYLDLPDDLLERLERLSKVTRSAKALFMKANGELPRRLRAQKVGSVGSPIDADIYRAPEEG